MGGFYHGSVNSDDYVILAGGGYKNITDFATSGHDHDGRYLKLAGGTMTGAIRRYYGSSTTDPMVALTSNDLDVWLWRINRGYNAIASASGLYGFGLKYLGTGSGNDKKLVLYADNLTGTLVAAMSMQQNGIISLIKTPNVNGTNVSLVGHTHDDRYITALGTDGDYLTWTKNGSVNNLIVPYATNADTLDGYHEDVFFRYRGELYQNNGHNANTLKIGSWIFRGSAYGYVGSGAAHANVTSENSTIEVFQNLQLSTPAWSNSVSYRVRWGGETNSSRPNAWSAWYTFLSNENYTNYVNNASLTLQTAGTTQTTFYANDDTAKTFNVTCDNIGAATSEHSHGLTNSNFFKSLPSTSGNLTWKEAFGYNPKGALLMSVRINSPAPSWCVGNYGSGILYGGGDTKGFMSSAYSSPYIMWAGGNGTTDSATPVWTMSISGANGGSYNLANFLTGQDHYKTSVTAGTAGTSSATSGSTLSVPYVTVNENGHVTGYGTHTHTISGFLTTLDHYKTSITAGTAGTSSTTSGATLEVPYVSMNGNGHVTGYGTHTHSVTAIVGSYTSNGGQLNPNYFGTNRVGFLMMNTTVNNNSLYKDWMIMDCYGGNDVGGGVAIGVNRQSLGVYIMRSAAARTSWAESAELIGTHNYTTYCATAGHNHDGRYVRAYDTTNDNIDSDWGQSFKTFDPIPSGTPPEQNPNITLLSLGNSWNRRKMLAFTYSNDNIYYRRHTDQGFSSWVQLLHSGNSSISKSGETLTVTINGTSQSLTNTWRGITDSYSGTATETSLSLKGGNDLYNALLNGYANSAGDADTLDGYHFSDLESRYVNVTGDIMTGGILMSSMEASGKRWMYGVTRNSGFKYDYAGNESFIISSGTYSLSSISFYTANRLSMSDSTGQWNSVTPDMRIKNTYVSINSDINTSYQLYVNGSTYSTGFYKADSSDSYILLGGGGHKLITDLISNGNYECLAYYSTSTKISSANSLKYTSDPGYLTVGNEAWISGNCIGFIDGMNIRFYDDSDDADPTDFPYIHDNISLFSGGYATIFDAYQPIVVSNDIRLVDPTNYSWKDLYANNGTFSGTLSASSGTFIGTLSALNSKFYVNSSGAFWTSDIRAKKDIHQITKEEVDKLFSTPDGYLKGFTFKDGDIKSFGVIAQEIIEYCPECIDEGELLHVNYDVALSKIMAGMYLKIKELEKEIEILRNR